MAIGQHPNNRMTYVNAITISNIGGHPMPCNARRVGGIMQAV